MVKVDSGMRADFTSRSQRRVVVVWTYVLFYARFLSYRVLKGDLLSERFSKVGDI